jgi:protein SCO1/2
MFCTFDRRIGGIAVLSISLFGLAACAKRYPVEGLVLRVDRAQRTVVVSHHEIRNYMPAMAMPFRVREAAELDGLAPGSRVRFQLVVGKRENFVRHLRVTDIGPEGLVEDNGRNLRLPPAPGKLAIGAEVPDFTLTDQSSRTVRLSDFRGHVIAVNFIYTRCPLPEVCPRLSAGFARLGKRFAGKDLVLLSVTLDPQYDTPDVLARYGKIWKADPAGWRFLTGDLAEIRRVADRFGLVWWPEEGLLAHTSQTGVIGRDGKLVALVEGSNYSADQLGDLIAIQLEAH